MNKEPVVLTNDPQPIKRDFITILHKAALGGQLGYMDGMDPDTGDIVPLLVGLDFTGKADEFRAYPLAQIFLDTATLKHYLSPDGKGNYVNLNADEAEE